MSKQVGPRARASALFCGLSAQQPVSSQGLGKAHLGDGAKLDLASEVSWGSQDGRQQDGGIGVGIAPKGQPSCPGQPLPPCTSCCSLLVTCCRLLSHDLHSLCRPSGRESLTGIKWHKFHAQQDCPLLACTAEALVVGQSGCNAVRSPAQSCAHLWLSEQPDAALPRWPPVSALHRRRWTLHAQHSAAPECMVR